MSKAFIQFILALLRKTAGLEVYGYQELDEEDHKNYGIKEGQILVVLRDRYIRVFNSREELVQTAISGKPINFGPVTIRAIRIG